MNNMNRSENKLEMSPEALAQLGDGRIAYVRRSDPKTFRHCFRKPMYRKWRLVRNCSRCMPLTARRSCLPTAAKLRSLMPGARSWRPSACTDQESVIIIRYQQSGGRDPVAALFNFYPPYLITDTWPLIPVYAADAEGIAKPA